MLPNKSLLSIEEYELQCKLWLLKNVLDNITN